MNRLAKMKSISMSPKEFRKGAKKSTLFKKVNKKLQEKQSSIILIDEEDMKRAEDWSVLANQIVGSETY